MIQSIIVTFGFYSVIESVESGQGMMWILRYSTIPLNEIELA
jgi:hypothetical protein